MEPIKYILEALRGTGSKPKKSMFPVERNRRAYDLYVQEAQINGEEPLPYDQWALRNAT